MKTIVLLGIVLFNVVATRSAGAHDLVLLPSGKDELLIRFGHPGEYEPADLPRLFTLDAYARGKDKAVSLLEVKPVKMGVDWLIEHLGLLTHSHSVVRNFLRKENRFCYETGPY